MKWPGTIFDSTLLFPQILGGRGASMEMRFWVDFRKKSQQEGGRFFPFVTGPGEAPT